MSISHLRSNVLLFTFVLSLFWIKDLQAQIPTLTIEPTYVSIADGLVSPTVNDVLQDRYGLIWVATANGLQKYDGYRFETFKHASDKPTSIQHNFVWSLFEDSNHDIWVSTNRGVSKYIRSKNEFKNYDFAPIFNFTSESEMRGFKFFEDSQQRLWVNTLSVQLVQYDSVNDTWKRAVFEVPDEPEPEQIGISLEVIEDLEGNLWFGSSTHGLMRQAKNENVFKPLPIEKLGGMDFSIDEITALYADNTNTLWITTRSGVFKFNPETGSLKTIKKYTEAIGDGWNRWNKILPDNEGNIWIANNFRGMLKFEGISDRYTEIEIAGKMIMRSHGWNITLTQFMIDRSGIFWFGSREAGLVKYDPVNKPFNHLVHDPNNPNSLSAGGAFGIHASKVKPGVVYVGTRGGGVNAYNPRNQTFEKITFKVEDDMFGGSARGIAEDTDGSLWLGSWGDGVVKLDKNYKEVIRFKYDSINKNSLSHNQVRVLKTDNRDQLWIGTNNGVNIINTKTNTTQRVKNKHGQQYPDQLIAELEKLIVSDQKIGAIENVIDNQNLSETVDIKTSGTYWIMAVGEMAPNEPADFGWIENVAKDTLWIMDNYDQTYHAGGAFKNRIVIGSVTLQPGSYTLRYKTDDSHAYGKWNELAPDQTSLYGIALIQPREEGQFQSLQAPKIPESEELLTSGSNIQDIEVTEKYIWVTAMSSGLDRIDPVTNQLKNYVNIPGNANSLSHNNIRDIHADSRGMIWLATDEGVSKFDPTTETFTRYNEADGLPTNLTEGIVEGDDGEMWIATQNGLSQMVINDNLGKATFINYNSLDGLGTDVFLSLTNTRAADGRFYFGGDHGLTTFSSISSNKTPPAIIISNLFISNKSVLDMKEDSPLNGSLLETKSISLPFNQNSLGFEFAALHYANPKKNQYAHMLKGYDLDWIYDNRNFAAYTNLDPGKYEFMVRASNAYGIWNEEGLKLEITILPPWWRTWWAYTVYVFAFGFVIFGTSRIMRSRIKARERERSRERELSQAKEIEKAYTELKATQSQLIHSEKMASLGELTAGIAHEIQNPLNFVNNFSEVSEELIDEMNEEMEKGNMELVLEISNDLKKNLSKIKHHGKRADAIVKGMLEHSRNNASDKNPTNINALADEFLRLSYHGLRAKDKSFSSDFDTVLDPNLPLVNVVAQDVGRVILNLINNAFYAVGQRAREIQSSNGKTSTYKPKVSVQTRLVELAGGLGGVEICIKDNGSGIPKAIKDKIFQPFFTTKPTGSGTGLGLSLSYDIVKSHGGDLRVKSTEGEGTEMIIFLPIEN